MRFTTNEPEAKPVDPTPIRVRVINGQEGSLQVFCDGIWKTIAYLRARGTMGLMHFDDDESPKLEKMGLVLEPTLSGLKQIKVI